MQKKCSRCGEWKDRATHYYTAGRYKNGTSRYASACKPCARAVARERARKRTHSEEKKAYLRAHSKALTRLRKLCPELYEMCMKEELEKEGVTYGLSQFHEAS